MVFSSTVFLFIFLPVTYILYLICKKTIIRNIILIAASLVFYAYGEPQAVFLMILSIIVNYLFGLGMTSKHKKTLLIISIIFNLLMLYVFKYLSFSAQLVNDITGLGIPVPTIELPVGISFFTFQAMSYVIDVYNEPQLKEKNILNIFLYISLFPQLIAGPIVKFSDLAEQINTRSITLEKTTLGIRRFIYGLAKKMLIANTMGQIADAAFNNPVDSMSAGSLWIGAVAYMLQIFFDFSGYSDMAIGLGKMFGFEFKENFNYPFAADSMQDFWRKWNISVSTWFKEYVYIPLGGNRKGLPRQCLNLLIVWMLTGLWHGASLNFVIWGLYYAVILIIEKLFFGKVLSKMPGIFRHIYALLIVAFGWGIFYYTDFGQFTLFVNRLVTYSADEKDIINWMIAYLPTAAVAVFASTKLYYRFVRSLRKSRFMFLEIPILAVLFVLCVSALVSQSYNPFIYFRF